MKDLRGSHASAVRNAIFRNFNLSKCKKNSQGVFEWKKSKEVADSYKKLYNDNAIIENIVDVAFPSSATADEAEYSDIYIYTASVCDIILNPDYPILEVSRKALVLRFQRFKVFVEFNLSFFRIINQRWYS
jgi:hypothetical protein